MNDNSEFDVFVSYFEETGKDDAETIRSSLKRYGIKTFVSHIERPRYSGDFEENVNNIIANCKYFILLLNIDTLGRPQVIREVKRAYPNGLTPAPIFVIFREDLEEVERSTTDFLSHTGIDIGRQNQHDYRNSSKLAAAVTTLCKSGFFNKTKYMQLQQAPPSTQQSVVSKQSAGEFKHRVRNQGLWRYFETKAFLFRKTEGNIWKIQFLYVRLLESKPQILEGLSTPHLNLTHNVNEINHLNDLLDNLVLGKNVTIAGMYASLELIQMDMTYDFCYRFHPGSAMFGVSEPCHELLKPGSTSAELSQVELELISEFNGEFDNLPDAVSNILDLSFWDGSYSPFVVVLAPIPVKIDNIQVMNQRIVMKLVSKPSINLNSLKVILQAKNKRGRQVGRAQTLRAFTQSNDREICFDSGIELDNTINNITLRLYYNDEVIEQRYFKKDETDMLWIET